MAPVYMGRSRLRDAASWQSICGRSAQTRGAACCHRGLVGIPVQIVGGAAIADRRTQEERPAGA
jgi:hypothetical protein